MTSVDELSKDLGNLTTKIVVGKFTLIKRKKPENEGLHIESSEKLNAEAKVPAQLPEGGLKLKKNERRAESSRKSKQAKRNEVQDNRRRNQIFQTPIEGPLPPPEKLLSPDCRKQIGDFYKSSIVPRLLPANSHSLFLQTLLDRICKSLPSAEIHPFGSTVNNLGLLNSDIDLTLVTRTSLNRLSKIIRTYYSDVFVVARARVPIIKFRDGEKEIDININRLLGVHNSRLLAAYTYLNSTVKALIMLVKAFVKKRGVGDASAGGLSSYSWSLMVLGYLMSRGIISNLQEGEEWVENKSKNGKVEVVNVAFRQVDRKDYDIESLDFDSDDGISQIYFDFLYYVGYTFTTAFIFSIKDGGIVPNTIAKNRNTLVVLDPFENNRNCAASLRNLNDYKRIMYACQQELAEISQVNK